ncbi:hypothetical protein [Rhodocyclus tenuis]|uniref:Uncharacterized protein n=1 Tax=Rhodocyclus tenuis TaxID=1066 RepID=A0A840FYI9_RHOTE|nr:hypothetical protein [Rhodocyclus tenuis]MBB4247187.1 hypothetical protein [Rhodocyclus tenuis]
MTHCRKLVRPNILMDDDGGWLAEKAVQRELNGAGAATKSVQAAL